MLPRSTTVIGAGAPQSAARIARGEYVLKPFCDSTYRPLLLLLPLVAPGCRWLPQVAQKPVVRNPFPQLSQVAVAPFINLSTEPTVDGRQFAVAYFNELQLVPGFEVVPLGVVEDTMKVHNINLASPAEARRLAQILGVDAVVIGP